MRNVLAIARRELGTWFVTPWAWVVLAIMLLVTSFFFVIGLFEFMRAHADARGPGGWAALGPERQEFRNLTDGVVVPVWGALMVLTVFLSPFVSMRLFAEERKQKTFELLMTTPVRSTEIVLGKFLGGVGMMGITIGVGIVFPLTLAAFGGGQSGQALDWPTVLLGYAGLLSWVSACIAVGMFVSSLTESQFLAAFVTLAILVPWWLMGDVAGAAADPLRTVLQSAAFSTHLAPMLHGETDLAALVFFPSVIILFLFLTQRRLEAFRWA